MTASAPEFILHLRPHCGAIFALTKGTRVGTCRTKLSLRPVKSPLDMLIQLFYNCVSCGYFYFRVVIFTFLRQNHCFGIQRRRVQRTKKILHCAAKFEVGEENRVICAGG